MNCDKTHTKKTLTAPAIVTVMDKKIEGEGSGERQQGREDGRDEVEDSSQDRVRFGGREKQQRESPGR